MKPNLQEIRLTYLKNGIDIIVLKHFPCLIGRENIGKEVLCKIFNSEGEPVISREHCEILMKGATVQVTDTKSKNSTYIKRNDRTVLCVKGKLFDLKQDDILVLGREEFLVDLIFQDFTEEEPQWIKCRSCGYEKESNTLSQICPECGSVQDFEAISRP